MCIRDSVQGDRVRAAGVDGRVYIAGCDAVHVRPAADVEFPRRAVADGPDAAIAPDSDAVAPASRNRRGSQHNTHALDAAREDRGRLRPGPAPARRRGANRG